MAFGCHEWMGLLQLQIAKHAKGVVQGCGKVPILPWCWSWVALGSQRSRNIKNRIAPFPCSLRLEGLLPAGAALARRTRRGVAPGSYAVGRWPSALCQKLLLKIGFRRFFQLVEKIYQAP